MKMMCYKCVNTNTNYDDDMFVKEIRVRNHSAVRPILPRMLLKNNQHIFKQSQVE